MPPYEYDSNPYYSLAFGEPFFATAVLRIN